MDKQLRLCLSMSLRLRFIFLSLGHYSARRLFICSTSGCMRKLQQHALCPSRPYSHPCTHKANTQKHKKLLRRTS